MSRPASAACHSSSSSSTYASAFCLHSSYFAPNPVTPPLPPLPVQPSTPLLSLPPTSPNLFHLPTNPTSNASHHRPVICGLSNSLRGLLSFPKLSLSLLPLSLFPPLLRVSRLTHGSIIFPSVYLSICLSISLFEGSPGSPIRHTVEFFIRMDNRFLETFLFVSHDY